MSIVRMLGRLASVAALFGLYSLAQALSLMPTIASGGKASVWVVAAVFTLAFGWLLYLLASVYRYFLKSERPGIWGARRLNRRGWRFVLAMAGALILIQAANVLAISQHWLAQSSNQTDLMALMQQAPLAMALVTVVGAPPVEELLFRALLMHSFPHLEKKRWLWVAGGVSAVVFGLLHAWVNEPLNLGLYTAMGAVFAATYAYTKDIRYSILLHFLNNFIALFL